MMKPSFKTLTSLVGAASLTALVGLPAIAQVNNNPSIFNEAPYNRSTSDQGDAGALNTNPSIFNEAPYNRSTSDTVAPGSSVNNSCTTQSSSMSSSTMMDGNMASSSTYNSNLDTNRVSNNEAVNNGSMGASTMGSSSYLGSDTTGTQNRAIYGMSPSSNNFDQSSGNNFSRSNFAGGSYTSAARINTIHPTDGPSGGFVIRRFEEMMNEDMNARSSTQTSVSPASTTNNSSIYRVTPSDVSPDSSMTNMESSSLYSSSTVCRP